MGLISPLINQKIDYIYSVSIDEYRDETRTIVYSNVPCRWEYSYKRSVTVQSDKLIYRVLAWILPTYTLQEDYLFEKDSEIYKVSLIQKKYDITGTLDHWKVFLV